MATQKEMFTSQMAENLQECHDAHSEAEVARNRAVALRAAGRGADAALAAKECYLAAVNCERAAYRIEGAEASEDQRNAAQQAWRLRRQAAAYVAQADNRGSY